MVRIPFTPTKFLSRTVQLKLTIAIIFSEDRKPLFGGEGSYRIYGLDF